jgi:hypothetical protein
MEKSFRTVLIAVKYFHGDFGELNFCFRAKVALRLIYAPDQPRATCTEPFNQSDDENTKKPAK